MVILGGEGIRERPRAGSFDVLGTGEFRKTADWLL
jgi:hypothetical protein